MATTIADYIASLRLKPDLQSLKKADRWFQLLDSKVARYSKKISKSGNLLGVGQTVKGITDLQKAEDKRSRNTISNLNKEANAHVNAYTKQLNQLKKISAQEAKLRKVTSASQLMNSHIPLFRQNQALVKEEAARRKAYEKEQAHWRREGLKEQAAQARQLSAQDRQRLVMDRMHGQGLYMNRQFDARRNVRPNRTAAYAASGVMGLTGSGIGGIATAGVAGLGLNQLNKAIRELEMLPISLEAVTGSATRAAAELSYLNNVGNDLGLTTRSIAPSYTKFLASAIGSPLEANAQTTFKSVLKYGQVVGMDKESIKGTLKALTQISNKQKMMA